MAHTTSGFVAQLLNGSTPSEPRVQILSVKEKTTTVNFMISDGDQATPAVLSQSLKEQYDQGKLSHFKNLLLIVLEDYCLQQRDQIKVCIVSKFKIVGQANAQIGNPTSAQSNVKASPVPPAQSNTNPNNSRSSSAQKGNYQPISSLNPYQSNWRIKVRVTKKSPMRTYQREGRENVVFSVDLLDREGTEIQATMFNEACKKFYTIFEEQGIYLISGGRVTIARKRYTHIQNDYAITLNENSQVTLVPTDENSNSSNGASGAGSGDDIIMKQVYRFGKIADISGCESGSFVDVCGVVHEVKELGQLISKRTGKQVNKRTVMLCDDSSKLVELTLWDQLAETYDENALGNNAVVVIKAARVGEYQGVKQLSCNNLTVNPFDSVPQAKQLRDWWQTEGLGVKFEPLAIAAGAGTGGGSKMPRYNVLEARESRIGYSDSMFGDIAGGMSMTPMRGGSTPNKGSYFSMVGTITRSYDVSSNNGDTKRLPWYKACTDPNANNAKVTESNGMYWCSKTNKEYPGYVARYVTRFGVADGTGTMWLSAFNDAATMILGTECSVVENNYNNQNLQAVDKVFKDSLFKRFVFRVRAKSNDYNGEQRVRYDIMSVQLFDYSSEGHALVDKIESLRSMC